ncbi:MAG: phage major tail tube protein [Eubacterium sp.]|nr:phage major tail tube protein [Eubacterium sp.]
MNNRGLWPEIINNYHVYNGNSENLAEPMLGIGDNLELPQVNEKTTTLSGAGIIGDIEVNNPGDFEAFDMNVPFVCICEGMFDINSKQRTYLTIRATMQSTEKATGAVEYSGIKVVVGGKVKAYNLGSLQKGQQGTPGVTLACDYLKIEAKYADNTTKTLFELDKYNEVYIVNGVDMLKEIKEFS